MSRLILTIRYDGIQHTWQSGDSLEDLQHAITTLQRAHDEAATPDAVAANAQRALDVNPGSYPTDANVLARVHP